MSRIFLLLWLRCNKNVRNIAGKLQFSRIKVNLFCGFEAYSLHELFEDISLGIAKYNWEEITFNC